MWNSAPTLRLAIQQQTEEALNLVRLASEAHRNGLPSFEPLYAECQRSHEVILAGICTLTDEEADLIEPKFTEFEQELDRLS